MKKALFLGACAIASFIPHLAHAQAENPAGLRDLYSDTWVAIDDLGRSVSIAPRPPQAGKTVAMFYYVNKPKDYGTPVDISRALAANPDQPALGNGGFTWWGEPQVGYFRSDDPWVLRHDLSMLADAGVDAVFFDTTNSSHYPETVRVLAKVAFEMRTNGERTPQFAFVTHFQSPDRVQNIYNDFYKDKSFEPLWFKWSGKPIIFGNRDDKKPDGTQLSDEVKNFFTWRRSWAWDAGPGKWQWIDRYPQKPGQNDTGATEQMPVAAASHPSIMVGRSFHDGKQPPIDGQSLTPDTGRGLFYAEQWKQALQVDPSLIWLTQWNEWTAVPGQAGNGNGLSVGKNVMRPGDYTYIDVYNREFSRDIAPENGPLGDNYYMQTVDGIRKFKGARPTPVENAFHTINIAGDFAQWNAIANEYRDTIGDTTPRDFPGQGNNYYVNRSGRNDIVRAKATCDATNLYFYVQTREPLTTSHAYNWMQLLINADADYSTGWRGFDAVVNGNLKFLDAKDDPKPEMRRLFDNKLFPIEQKVEGNEMMLSIPRLKLGLSDPAHVVFDFHWVDNAQIGGDIKDWWSQGDSAPNGRFNYRYENTAK
ncbi:hypothetical protein IAD21_03462 [Abditibacteriota bacterium]|nr:hypothetical protein IAD21_03462 [Abditibacteriota bacterium]